MGKEDEKKDKKKADKDKKDKDKSDKDKKDKDKSGKDKKDKDKSDKDKKDKDKSDKDKKDKDKSDKDKKDKDKKKDKEKEFMPDQEWKIVISKNLDELIGAYGKIVKVFQDIDNYILKDSKTVEEFKEKIQKAIADLPEHHQSVFIAFLDTIQ